MCVCVGIVGYKGGVLAVLYFCPFADDATVTFVDAGDSVSSVCAVLGVPQWLEGCLLLYCLFVVMGRVCVSPSISRSLALHLISSAHLGSTSLADNVGAE